MDGASFEEESFGCAAGTRRYLTYVLASAKDGITRVIVMLHGCTWAPEDFAAGTGTKALAETHRFVVVYPGQSRGDNAQSCWNWFSKGDQKRDRGEPAIIAGLTRAVIARHAIPDEKVFVAGLSAGAAMAGRESMSTPCDRATPTLVFHGSADATVHPSNGDGIVRQALQGGGGQSLQIEDVGTVNGRTYRRVNTSTSAGSNAVEHWIVDGMGHAWSGGKAAGSYTEPQGPDASAEMVRFFFDEVRD